MSQCPPFHLAIPVDDLAKAAAFYGGVLACTRGRSAPHWIDWNLYGHQLVTHLVSRMPYQPSFNPVDSKSVPVPHFGLVLDMAKWRKLADSLQQAKVEFIIQPYIRFAGEVGEQATMFFLDPAGNALEFKAFTHPEQLFAR